MSWGGGGFRDAAPYIFICMYTFISRYVCLIRASTTQALRCKLDESLRVRCAAQRVLERLAPNVLADLACRGARGMSLM